jgi:hypothetical protein
MLYKHKILIFFKLFLNYATELKKTEKLALI